VLCEPTTPLLGKPRAFTMSTGLRVFNSHAEIRKSVIFHNQVLCQWVRDRTVISAMRAIQIEVEDSYELRKLIDSRNYLGCCLRIGFVAQPEQFPQMLLLHGNLVQKEQAPGNH
jgi:hypothetical protein